MLFHGVALLSLLPLVLVLPAAGLECRIYVDNSEQHVHGGTDNTSCWSGGAKIPCYYLEYALDGIKTLQDNCSKGIDIYLYPGRYELHTDSLEQQVQRNNVSIIGIIDNSTCEVVTVYCDNDSPSFNWSSYNILFQCVEVQNCLNPPVTTCTNPNKPLPEHISNLTLINVFQNQNSYLSCSDQGLCQCEYLTLYAQIYDHCTHDTFSPDYLQVCIISTNSSIAHDCYTAKSSGPYKEYKVEKCFDDYINAPIELSLFIKTIPLSINTTLDITVTAICAFPYTFNEVTRKCINPNDYVPIACDNAYNIPCFEDICYCSSNLESCCENDNVFCDNPNYCYDNTTNKFYTNCASKGVPVNNLYTCVECGEYDLLIFIAIEIVPITLMVLLIIIFNIQLTNGSINGVVFYSQSIAIVYPVYINYMYYYFYYVDFTYEVPPTQIPCNIFNLDFTQFLYNYPLCISTNATPLGVLSFWYVIGFYPLLLLLLLYVWMTLYDKGYKCVVFITRPFHRCMARFWSMTGIEPSFTHSIASIYILCFTQLAATSFKILTYNPHSNDTRFSYDMKQGYFQGVHAVAGSFAILVLLIMIALPTLYILLYRFQWFHKLLDCLHLRKQLLISLGDVFTGPYKNGAENTYDHRFFAGLYLLARIIVLCQFILGTNGVFMLSVPILQTGCSFLLAVMVLIFRPFRRNIHNFTEFILIFAVMGFGLSSTVASFLIYTDHANDLDNGLNLVEVIATITIPCVNGLFFVIIIPVYIIYQVYKMIKSYYRYCKRNIPVAIRDQEDEEYQPLVGNDDDWVADRMENPQEYDERHVPGRMDDETGEDQEPVTIATAATLGSTNNATIN